MSQVSSKSIRYASTGAAVLCLLILLGWFASLEKPLSPDQESLKVATTKPRERRAPHPITPPDDSTNEEIAARTDDSATTNAAAVYRQAYELLTTLKSNHANFRVLFDWQANVDATVEAELCENVRPMCDLMHQAAAMANCDWGQEPTIFVQPPPSSFPGAARDIASATIWSAAHCRSNDVVGATDDALSVLQLARQVSRCSLDGSFTSVELQAWVASYVAQNLGLFHGRDSQRLVTAFNDPAYEDAATEMQQFADAVEHHQAELVQRIAEHFAVLPDDDLKKIWPSDNTNHARPDRTALLAMCQQIPNLLRGAARALASSDADDYEAWQRHASENQASNPLAKTVLEAVESSVEQLRAAEINRALVVAGLAVAQEGPNVLQSHPDPASGKPFVYSGIADGFELQSSYQSDGEPITMKFKLP